MKRTLIAFALVLSSSEMATAAPVDFARDIHPILKQNCLPCHNTTKAKAGLNLETPQDMIRGGDTGTSLEPGNADASFVYTTAAHIEEPTMPPKNDSKARKLTADELALLKRWIDEGAKGGAVHVPAPTKWKPLTGSQPIYSIAMGPNSRYAVFGRGSEAIVYDLVLKEKATVLDDPEIEETVAHGDAVQVIAMNDDLEIATGGFRIVKRWAPTSPVPSYFAGSLPGGEKTLAVSPDGARIAVGLPDGSIRLHESGNPAGKAIVVKDHGAAITALAFSPDGTHLLSASTDQVLRWRKVANPQESRERKADFVATALALVEGGKGIVAASGNAVRRGGVDLFGVPPTPGPEAKQAAEPAAKSAAKGEPSKDQPKSPPKPSSKSTPPAQPRPAQPKAPPPSGEKGKPRAPAKEMVGGKAQAKSQPKPEPSAKPAPKPEPRKPDFATLAGHGKPVTAIASLSGDAGSFVSAGDDGFLVVWKTDASPARKIATGGPVAAFAASPTGARLLSAPAKGAAALWNPADGKKVADLSSAAAQRAEKASLERRLAWLKKQIPAFDKGVTDAGAQVKSTAEAATAAANDLVAKRAAREDALAEVRTARRVEAAAQRRVESVAEGDPARKAADDALAAATKEVEEKQALFETAERDWGLAERNRTHAAYLAGKAVEDHTAAQQERAIAGEEQKRLEKAITDLDATIAKTAGEFAVVAASFSSDGKLVALVDSTGALLLFAAENGHFLERAEPGEKLVSLAAAGGRRFAALTESNRLVVIDVARRWELSTTIGDGNDPDPLPGRVTGLAYSPDGFSLATGCGVPSRSGELKVWSTTDGSLVAENLEAHADTITAVSFSPDSSQVATAASDHVVRIWNVRTLQREGNLEGHSGHVLAIDWRDDQRAFVSAAADQTAKVWRMPVGESIQKLEGYEKEITAVAFAPYSDTMLIASGDPSVKYANQPLPGPKAFVHSGSISPDGAHLLAGDAEGNLFHWDAARKLVNQVEGSR